MGLFNHGIHTEEIQHQKDDTTIQEISNLLSKLINFDLGNKKGILDTFAGEGLNATETAITNLIKRRFGLTLYISFTDEYPTTMFLNGDIMTNEFLDTVSSKTAHSELIQTAMERELPRLTSLTELKVDSKNARIEGLDKDILSGSMVVGLDLITQDGMTADELATLIIHEVGRMFTLIEERVRVARQNYHSLSLKPTSAPRKDVAALVDKYRDSVEKVKDADSDTTYSPNELKEMFKGLENDLLKAARIDSGSSGGFPGVTIAADNFVIQLGGADILTTALAKAHNVESWRVSNERNTMVIVGAIAAGVIVITMCVWLIYVAYVFGELYMAIAIPVIYLSVGKSRKTPEVTQLTSILPRFKQIRQSTIKQLKILKDKETTRATLYQINTIDETIALLHESNKITDPTDMIADMLGDVSNNNILINKAKLQIL